jgi:hypothetical protein
MIAQPVREGREAVSDVQCTYLTHSRKSVRSVKPTIVQTYAHARAVASRLRLPLRACHGAPSFLTFLLLQPGGGNAACRRRHNSDAPSRGGRAHGRGRQAGRLRLSLLPEYLHGRGDAFLLGRSKAAQPMPGSGGFAVTRAANLANSSYQAAGERQAILMREASSR